jgi:AraC-like DNA-binding protein
VQYLYRLPSPCLRPWIAGFWGWRAKAHEVPSLRIFPSVYHEWVIHSGAPLHFCFPDHRVVAPLMHIMGSHHHHFEIQATGPVSLFAIRFQPGSLAHLLRASPAQLNEPGVPLSILSRPWVAGAEAIQDTEAFSEQVQLAERLLTDYFRACQSEPLLESLRQAIHVGRGQRTIATLSPLVFSQRTLERRFLADYGYSPKHYSRIVRLQELLRAQPTSLVDLALTHGFSDQPHMYHEIKAMTGYTPRQWFQHQQQHLSLFYKTRAYSVF